MNWKEIIAAGGATQRAFREYAEGRIDQLSKTCTSLNTDDRALLVARAQIAEMRALVDLPETLRKEQEHIALPGPTQRGY